MVQLGDLSAFFPPENVKHVLLISSGVTDFDLFFCYRFVFLAIYTAEMIIKSVAKGFILNKYTYLRNPWNWLDFVVITSGYATIGMEVGNLAGLRTFRVLRALKTVSIMPGKYKEICIIFHCKARNRGL